MPTLPPIGPVFTFGMGPLVLINGAFESPRIPFRPALSSFGRRSEILQQVDAFAEGNQQRLILGPNHVVEELRGGRLLDVDQTLLAGADVDQQAERQRQIVFPRELLDGLLFAVLENLEVVLAEVRIDLAALLRPHGIEDVHQVDVDLDGRLLIGGVCSGSGL